MRDFIKLSLTKNPKKRPAAEKLLQVISFYFIPFHFEANLRLLIDILNVTI